MLLVTFAACGGDDGDSGAAKLSDTELAEETNAKLKECSVYIPPQNPEEDKVRDDLERCVARCILDDASCEDLLALSCDLGLKEGDPFLACVRLCPLAPDDGFKCDNGWRIPFQFVCDGNEDCLAGEEEDRDKCEPYLCDDGQPIFGGNPRCDNEMQCYDGSDEADCPFTCE